MKKFLSILNKVFAKFPVTYITSILISLLYVFCYENLYNYFEFIFNFLLPFGIASFLVETIFDTKKKKTSYLLAVFLGLLFLILTRFNTIANNIIFQRVYVFYYICTFLISIYYNYKSTKQTFSKYAVSCFSNLLEVSIIYFVLNIGLILIFLLIDFLLKSGVLSDYIDKILVLLLGSYYVPASIYAVNNYNEVNKFINVLVTKILFILLLTAYVVIYIYLIKIFVTFNIPSNVIFRILSILFIIGTVINIMGNDIEENKLLKKLHYLLPYLFIPFILLQCYSLGIRIISNGLTILRYLGILLIIFELIYTIFHFLNKDNGLLIFVFVGELVIALLIPFINFYDLPLNTQYKVLLQYKNNNKVTEKVVGAYDYLREFEEGQQKIDKLLTEQDIEKITSYDNNEEESNSYYYFNEENTIDIEGYKTIEFAYQSDSDEEIKYPFLFDKMNSCLEGNKDDCFENNNIFVVENKKIIIMNSECYYYGMDLETKFCDVSYYILTK